MRYLWALFWAAMTAVCGVLSLAVVVLVSLAGLAHATPIYSTSFESATCDARPSPIDGQSWNYEFDSTGHVRCGSPLDPPDGSRYYTWQAVTSASGLCPYAPLGSTAIVSGTTYYLGGVWRFDRIGGNPIWHNIWDFDKLHEINYSSATGFRWMIQSGYADSADTYVANKFQFSVYGSDAIFPGWTYYTHNMNGYSKASPLRSDYERWYSVVMGITAHQTNGTIRMWINGTQVMEHTGVQTMLAGATLEAISMSCTVGQPEYDAPSHDRSIDRMMLTTVFQDLVDAGYLADPQGGAAPVANFTCSPLTVQAIGSTTCTDASTNTPTSWSWTGGCGTSSAQNPSLSCTTGGLKNICLTASNAFGSSAQFCRNNYIGARYKKPTGVR